MPDRKAVTKYVPPDPVQTKAEFTGMEPVTMYLCPLCGHSRQDRDEMKEHIAQHPGGEA
jgi:hypothetical protein